MAKETKCLDFLNETIYRNDFGCRLCKAKEIIEEVGEDIGKSIS